MTLCINQAGTYRNIQTLCINDSGTYRNTVYLCINQAGTYRKILPIPPGALGSSYGGGCVICKPGGPCVWVISPPSAEVSRTWYSLNDSDTRSQQVSGCTGWFVPTRQQLQNPGYICRSFWGSPASLCRYWSSTSANGTHANVVYFNAPGGPSNLVVKGPLAFCIRSFRCVTY